MQSEKIAVIILVVIIVGALSAFLVLTYGKDISGNLFGENKENNQGSIETIAFGDCADVNYIGRYASNGTVFDSSYDDVENKTGGTPLQVFITLNSSKTPPKSGYNSVIEGFAEGLVGLKENDTKTIGPIPPEKAYGVKKLGVGDIFNSSTLAYGMNQTVKVVNLTNDTISLKWINMDNIGKFTMPQMILKNLSSTNQSEMIIIPPPYYIWENSTEITSTTNDTVTVTLTPNKSKNLSETLEQVQYSMTNATFIFPDATTATWDDNTVTITSSPEINKSYPYTFNYYGQQMNMMFTIVSIENGMINMSITYEGSNETMSQNINSTIKFNRTFNMPRLYSKIPLMYQDYLFTEDLKKQGYSLNKLAGESLIFDVEIVKIYKTSQE